jgi:Restriction Enzyme Adenine Methylase Associated
MAITDRNLSVGTKLYARYKGETHTAKLVEKEGAKLYRLGDGREFKSPSAASTAITGKACNGWAFWSVGDGAEDTGPVTSTTTRPASKVTPAPKPASKRRGRKTQTADEPPAGEAPDGDEAQDDAPPAATVDDGPVTCAVYQETFPSVAAATEHYYATHGKPDEEPTA